MVGVGKLTPPCPSSALPPQVTSKAAPKCISGRTSYLRVRLAFHLYPQLIPYFCTSNGFEPSPRCYRGFTLAMGSSLGFGSTRRNSIALLGLAFATAPPQSGLTLLRLRNSPAHSSIGTPSPRQVGAPTVCRLTVSDLFHSPPGVLFTFPSRYWFAIGRQGYLALEGGPPRFPQDFTCPAVLKNAPGASFLSPMGLSPATVARSRDLRLGQRFLTPWRMLRLLQMRLTTPKRHGPPGREASWVWAIPLSFATTKGISVDFFSSGYLDVSVPPLTSPGLRVRPGVPDVQSGGFPHSGIPGYAS